MRSPLQTLVVLAILNCASGVGAETRASAPAGGRLAALDVKVNLAAAVVRANTLEVPIGLEASLLPDEADVVVEVVALGGERRLVHVRVPVRGSGPSGPAWEALLAPGLREPVFIGMTGLSKGDPGERTGTAIRIVPGSGASRVLVGGIREDLRICGQTVTLIEPRAVDPATFELKPVAAQRLSDAEQAGATPLAAIDKGTRFEAPLGKLLAARGSSTPDSLGLELTDGNVRTVWRETRPGAGQGEFVVMAAPKQVPITRIQVAVSPPDATPVGAVPKTFYLVASERSYRVTLPESAARKAGEVFEVAFAEPLATSCLALVLDQASAAGLAHPDVGVAEMAAFSEFDVPGSSLDAVAEKLSGPRSAAATQVLERSGPGGLAAVMKAYGDLDVHGRALATDVAVSSDRCEDAGRILARALCEKEGEAPRKALEKLERCPAAASAMAETLRTDPASRTCVAPVLATLSPMAALEPIADALGDVPESDASTRSALRSAFGLALDRAGPGKLQALLSDPKRGPGVRLELLRAAEDRVVDATASSDAAIAELMEAGASMRVRYLLLGPLAVLSRVGDAAATARLVDAATRDADWPVRARAAELSAGLPGARDALVSAVRDPEPRVRAAALVALGSAPPPDAVGAALGVMAKDDWSFVKMQAANLLAHAPSSGQVDDALGLSLGDPRVSVRGAALVALARRRALSWRKGIRERLDDLDEDVHIRAAAASALGAICDVSAIDRLTELARGLAAGESGESLPLGLGALVGLAALHPADLQQRFAPLLLPSAPPTVRAAAERAVSARSVCP
jgi:HEAT repeat protein